MVTDVKQYEFIYDFLQEQDFLTGARIERNRRISDNDNIRKFKSGFGEEPAFGFGSSNNNNNNQANDDYCGNWFGKVNKYHDGYCGPNSGP